MRQKEEYVGIDYFRIIAALLVVAIHTSPLTSVDGTADFILTRVIARVAVPFFFMASGFFLLPGYMNVKDTEPGKLFKFLEKAAMLYGIAILLYLPINFYAGYFQMEFLLPNLIKDFVFDGTFYHLWYLPAAMMGATLTYLLLKKFKSGHVFRVALILYLIGLFGDSYYGIIEKVPFIKSFYDTIFLFSDYTRNGLFFAPIFFMLGGMVAKQRGHYRAKECLIGLLVSLVLMLTEGLCLHGFALQRHDSMYIMLLPCMFFLFQSLLFWRGQGNKSLRYISMIIYLIHPFMIALIRGFAKVTGLPKIYVDNSMLHYLAVAGCSSAAAILITMILQRKEKRKSAPNQTRMDRVWVEINLTNLRHNVKALCEALPDRCELMAVVKANAYGHGDVEIAANLNQIGVKAFAVATIDEGVHLRTHGIKGNILILGYTVPQRATEMVRYHLTQTVTDCDHAKQLNAFGKPIQVHIKIDTGMHRLGESCNNTAEIDKILQCKNLKVCGIFTHLCVADSTQTDDIEFTTNQIHSFYALLDRLQQFGHTLPKIHIQSSYGVLNYPELQCDYARIGIALYGALSSPDDKTRLQIDLQPVLALKARIALVRTIAAGESVSYGRQFIAQRDTCVAVLPIGYADGLPRNLSCGNGYVLIHGCRAPIIGRICMDQLMVDVIDIPDVRKNEIATLIGCDGSEKITAEQVAANAGTITNELLSRLGDRLERIFL